MSVTINQCCVCKSNPKVTSNTVKDVFIACSNKGCYVGKHISSYNHEEAVSLWNELNPTDAEILIPKPRENEEIRPIGFLCLIGISALMLYGVGDLFIWLAVLAMYVVMCWLAHRHDMRVEYPRTVKTYSEGYDNFDPYP